MSLPMLRLAPGVASQDASSEATRAAQAELAQRLPLDDPKDFENASRGKIAEITDGLITGKDGHIVWDRRTYAFLHADNAHDTVNPSLWPQARLTALPGPVAVVPATIWHVLAYDISVMSISLARQRL